MNTVKQNITLDVSKKGSQLALNAKRGDTGSRAVSARLTGEGRSWPLPQDGGAFLYCKKPDGTVVNTACLLEDGRVEITLPSSLFAAAGRVECELTVYDADANQLTSPRFEYDVEDALYDEDSVTATDDYSALTGALATANRFGSVSSSASTLAAGTPATAAAEIGASGVAFAFGIPQGIQGETGDTGNGIVKIERTSGTGAAGTTDTYTVTYTNGSTTTFNVYNGADGHGSGDMLKNIYDTSNKNTDIFAYADQAEADAKAASRPVTWTPTAAEVGARASDWVPTAAQVGARASDWLPTAAEVGAVPVSRTINGSALSSDIALTAEDVGAIAGESTTLWSGTQTTEATLTLADDWTNYKALVFRGGSTNQNGVYRDSILFTSLLDSVYGTALTFDMLVKSITGNTTALFFTGFYYSRLNKISGIK